MKRILIVLTAVVMCLALAGCGGKSKEKNGGDTPAAGSGNVSVDTNDGPKSPAEDPELLNRGDDSMKRQIPGVDDDLTLFVETGINDILLTEGGRLSLVTYGDLEASVGSEVDIANDVETFDFMAYGNGGYRALVFVRKDGTVSAVNPSVLIEEHRIEVLDNLGDLTNIISVYEQNGDDGTLILAMDADGDVTVLDEYLN